VFFFYKIVQMFRSCNSNLADLFWIFQHSLLFCDYISVLILHLIWMFVRFEEIKVLPRIFSIGCFGWGFKSFIGLCGQCCWCSSKIAIEQSGSFVATEGVRSVVGLLQKSLTSAIQARYSNSSTVWDAPTKYI
jgi:hypothetical protein